MKKKLLLSFAVFASALAVNAQTKSVKAYRGLTPETSEETNYLPVKSNAYNLNDASTNGTKRGSKTVIDTLKLVDAKAAYGTGNSYTRYTLRGVPKNADTTFYFTLVQSFPSKADVKVKSAGIVLQNGKKKDSVSVDVDFYGKGGKWIAQVNKKIALSANPGIYYFNLPQDKVFNTDTLTVEVSGTGPADTLRVLTTNSLGFGNQPKFVGSIVGDSLKVSSYGTPARIPVAGQVLSGVGVTAGTTLVAMNTKNGYWKISVAHPNGVAAGTNFTVPAFLSYGAINSQLGILTVPNKTQKPSGYFRDNIYWQGDTLALESDVYIYPVVEYAFNTDVKVDNKCLSTSKTVNVTLSNTEAIVKNPLFNRAAFDIEFRKLDKSKNYFYTYIGTSADKKDNLIDGAAAWKYSKTYTTDTVNDTLQVNEYLITWNKQKVDFYNKFENRFLISSKFNASNVVTKVPTANVAGKAVVSAKGGFTPYTYAWSDAAKTTTTEITATKGDYTATVTDANGCTSKTVAQIWIASVENLAIKGLSIYPNPTANELNVSFNAKSDATIKLVNVAGQVVAVKNVNGFANVTFNTADLNAGVYFVNITVAEGTFTQKVIKE